MNKEIMTNSRPSPLDGLNQCHRFIDSMNKHIDQILLSIKSDTLDRLNSDFALLSDSLDAFFQMSTTLISQIKKENPNKIEPQLIKEIRQLNIQHLSIIRSLMYCYKSNDMIAFIDLLEYELKDGLTQWKINFIPRIKSLLK